MCMCVHIKTYIVVHHTINWSLNNEEYINISGTCLYVSTDGSLARKEIKFKLRSFYFLCTFMPFVK